MGPSVVWQTPCTVRISELQMRPKSLNETRAHLDLCQFGASRTIEMLSTWPINIQFSNTADMGVLWLESCGDIPKLCGIYNWCSTFNKWTPPRPPAALVKSPSFSGTCPRRLNRVRTDMQWCVTFLRRKYLRNSLRSQAQKWIWSRAQKCTCEACLTKA